MIDELSISSISALKISQGQISQKELNLEIEDMVVKGSNINVYFVFRVTYNSNQSTKPIGRIYVKGNLVITETDNNARIIGNNWDRNREIPKDYAEGMQNYLYFECESRGILVAYAIGFPPPIPTYKVKL